ncbi:radical sam [Lucifera butyrica]|uniref:Anaerobic ribonucleoside-triphosphate reductase-activating protein n=1 Tax=Lucifera butyrica TaxID=1351585 RepID=A0A498R446_9FIRM|nr:anaerobic ribonucleoside-triphosphate reductase activating protein [Lucifera butyrica]VBB06201.1 radical sam [Lucifera butyrica]
MNLRIAGITKESIVDGPGLRVVVFTQGCPHHCRGCHNPQTHDPAGGTLIDTSEILSQLRGARLIRGITFSGGEPFLQAEPLAQIAAQVKRVNYDVVTYTGFVFEKLLTMSLRRKGILDLLQHTDLLVDGPYQEERRDLRLAFRGSANQRLIDVPRSLAQNKVLLWQDPAAVRLA